LILFDRPPLPSYSLHKRIPLVLATIGAVVLAETTGVMPIELGAVAGAVGLCLTGCIKPKEAFASIEWNLLFLIFGMLALGMAMDKTGAAAWLAQNVVRGVEEVVSGPARPFTILATVYLITLILTEILSNNAVAALMIPIALGIAQESGLSAYPFIIAVAVAASAAFATRIGYQTNPSVYATGGYRFRDFMRVGIPLNLICFVAAMIVIPRVWPF